MSGPKPPIHTTLQAVRMSPSVNGNRWGQRWPLLLPESIPIMRDERVPPDEVWFSVATPEGEWLTIACRLTLDA